MMLIFTAAPAVVQLIPTPFHILQPTVLQVAGNRKQWRQRESRGAKKVASLGREQFESGAGLDTLPKDNIASEISENGWLEYQFPFVVAYLQGLCLFQGG